jgi:arylformamidase
MAECGDIELQYNSRKAIPDHEAISAEWDVEAAAYRETADMELDIPYGDTDRSRFDFFRGAGADGAEPVCVYIHGGYWRSRDRKTFSHVARGLNERGVSVAIPSYDLCPQVSVADIITQMRAFLARLWERTEQYPAIAGHSAGAHLTASMLATDWSAVAGVPDDLVRHAYGLSGIYDLRPLLAVSVNEDLRLDEQTAEAVSPMLWPAPPADAEYVAAVGGLESDAFKRQSRELADRWAGAGLAAECVGIPGTHHFTIVNALTAPGSAIAERIARMAETAARRVAVAGP